MLHRDCFPHIILEVLKLLHEYHFEAYVVGGSLRDLLMGAKPKDWDIATDAMPTEVIRIFSSNHFKILSIAEHFGTITVIKDDDTIEITTYRTEGAYRHFRSPAEVTFVKDLKQDLSRRDFTMNALAYDPLSSDPVIDYFDGLSHIRDKQIVCVGDPKDRLSEDALRILRAIRFAATKGFELEKCLEASVMEYAPLLEELSYERITQEWNLWFVGDYAACALRRFAWIFTYIIKESYPFINIDFVAFTWEHLPADLNMRLSVLFLFVPHAKSILKYLRYKNMICDYVGDIAQYYPKITHNHKSNLKRYLFDVGVEKLRDIVKIKILEASYYHDCKMESFWQQALNEIDNIIFTQEGYTFKDLNINGRHLLELGVEPKDIKYHLKQLLFAVFDEKVSNRFDDLKDYFLKQR